MSSIGTLYVVSAPSGAGKSSLIKAYLAQSDHALASVSVSHTTRNPRPGEENGVHYHFVDQAKFKSMIADDDFFEWAEVFGNYYGTSKAAIENTLAQGIDVFLDIDWQGARQVKKLKPETQTIFIAPPSQQELLSRLQKRGQDSEEVIAKRMAEAQSEISHYNEFDYIIVNDNFNQAVQEFSAILTANRCKQAAQAQRHQALFNDLLG
ncbi:guanylate kinase [Catenovulum maritimum]|uniref:Guanylate kinase n=1 Tax=Catenovulum maritimum TaxID=1513271 RepID=A0A0J8GYB9_9ALTE|nr:guanylate kinase [Catenovulum maritimum]